MHAVSLRHYIWLGFVLAYLQIFATGARGQTPYLQYDMSVSGSTLVDGSGNGRNGTIVGATPTGNGPWQEYLHFDGNDWVQQGSFNYSQPFVVTLAFRIDQQHNGVYQILLGNRVSWTQGFSIYLNNNSQLAVDFGYVLNGSASLFSIMSDVAVAGDNQWHRVIMSFDGQEVVLYLDGRRVSRNRLPEGATVPAGGTLMLARQSYYFSYPFFGDMDEVRIYTDSQEDFATPQESVIDRLVLNHRSQLYFNFDVAPYSSAAENYFAESENTGNDAKIVNISGHTVYQSAAGVRGGAAEFDGSTADQSAADFLQIPTKTNSLDAEWSHGFAVSMWIKRDEDDTSKQYIISNNRDFSSPAGGFGVYYDKYNGYRLACEFDLPTGRTTLRSDAGLATGVWRHVVFTFDGSSAALYLNGKLEDQATFDETTLVAPPLDTYVGVLGYGGHPSNWMSNSGKMDELRIFSAGLSADEAYSLYRLDCDAMQANSTDISSSYSFDSPDPKDAFRDGGGLYRHLTHGATAEISQTGVFGRGLDVDGASTGWARMNGTAGTTVYNSAFTVSAWIKPEFPNGSSSHEPYYIISNDDDMGTRNAGGFALYIYRNSPYLTGRVQVVGQSVKYTVVSSAALVSGQWHHVTMTFDNNSLKLYVNGQLEASNSPMSAAMTAPPFDTYLGVLANAAPNYYRFVGEIDQVRLIGRAISADEAGILAKPYRLWTANAIRDAYVLPAELPWDLRPADEGLSVTAAAGEYEPASLVVENSSLSALNNLTVTASDLVNGQNVISASNVDVRLVKCWYQGYGDSSNYSSKHELKPELLVYDGSWITANDTTRTNTITNPTWPTDASTLQSVTLAAGRCQQYWLTIHVPAGTPAGVYAGTVTVRLNGSADRAIPLTATVPAGFALASSNLDYGIYYRGQIGATPPAVVGPAWKTTQQFQAELNNMVAHGISYPTTFTLPIMNPSAPLGQTVTFTRFDQEQAMRDAAGFASRAAGGKLLMVTTNYWHGAYLSPPSGWTQQQVLDDYDRVIGAILSHTLAYGYPEPLFMGLDEADGQSLTGQIPLYQKIHAKGGRSWAAVYSDYYDTLGAYGDLIDFPNMYLGDAIVDYSSVLADVHNDNHRMWTYFHPQSGVELPYLYRHNYGLWMWAAGFDGACDFSYMWTFGSSLWDDFDDVNGSRELNFVYPTSTGVVDTIEWEGFREGVDDVRYVSTLENLIAQCKAGRSAGNAIYDAGVREEAYLERLKARLQTGLVGENQVSAIRAALLRKCQALAALNP